MVLDISQIVLTIVVVCLFLWRMSYGTNNGLFAEAAGFISVLAAFAAVYYIMKIAGSILAQNYGNVIPKVGYLVIAFVIYSVMNAIGGALKKVRDVPVFGGIDRLLGAFIGFAEAAMIIYLIEYVTDIEIVKPVVSLFEQLIDAIKKSF